MLRYQRLETMGGQVFWVPHEENPADCLTKLKGNTTRLVQLMKAARYQLVDIEATLKEGKEYREVTCMRNPRPSVSTSTWFWFNGIQTPSVVF